MVQSAVLHFEGERYQIHAWTVMPNHVHVLFTLFDGWSLSDVLGSWKSFTAHAANKILGRSGQFWMEDYFDRYIRDLDHFERITQYIENNPVKAGLCEKSEDWPFGSAHPRWAANAAGMPAVPGKKPI